MSGGAVGITNTGPSCPDQFEPNNTKSTATTTMPLNATFTAQIATATDNDWYKFANTTAAKNIKIEMTSLPADYDLRLYRGSILLAASTTFAQDAKRGAALYDLHCTTCHYERIHKRDPSRSLVRTVPQLRLEVAQRAANTGQRFTVEDLDDIAEYLNRTHYRLEK